MRRIILVALAGALGLGLGCTSGEDASVDQPKRTVSSALTSTVGRIEPLGELPLALDAPDVLNQDHVAVGTDGTDFLVVWRGGDNFAGDIMGMRVDSTGSPLDPAPFLIGKEFVRVGVTPRVAFDGTNYLVVWAFATSLGDPREIWGNRVTTDGVPLDSDGFKISDGRGIRYRPDVAFNGQDFVVVWTDRRNDVDVWGNRVSSAGVPLDGDGFPIAEGLTNQAFPSIGCQSNQCLVSWRYEGTPMEIQAVRLDNAGTVLDPAPLLVAQNAILARVVPRSDYAVLWQEGSRDTANIFARPVPLMGPIIGATSTLFDGADEDSLVDAIRTANGIVLLRLSPSGVSLHELDDTLSVTGATVATGGDSSDLGIATNGTDLIATWPRPPGPLHTDAVAVGSVTNETLSQPLSSPQVVGRVPNTSDGNAVYFDGTAYGGIWSDRRSGDFKLYRSTFDDGEIGPEEPLWERAGEQYHPATAAAGDNRLVVWVEDVESDKPRLWAGTLMGGVPQEPTHVDAFVHQGARPALATDGTNFISVWRTSSNRAAWRLLDSAGTVGPRVTAPLSGTSQVDPSVAWGEENYLVAWTELEPGGRTVKAIRVGPDGSALDVAPIDVGPVDSSQSPLVFWNGTSFAVVFAVRTDTENRLEYVRIGSDGAFVDPSPVTLQISAARGIPSDVATDGEHAVLLYANVDVSDAWVLHIATIALDSGTVLSDEPVATLSPGTSVSSIAAGPEDAFGVIVPRGIEAPRDSTRLDAYIVDFGRTVVLAGSAIQTDEDTPVTVTVDVTLPPGVGPALSVLSEPTKGTVVIDGAELTYAPSPNENGTDEFELVFDDGELQAGPVTMTVEIAPVDDPPEFVAPTPDDQAVFETDGEGGLTIDVAVTDVDGDDVSLRLETAEGFGTLDSDTILWAPGAPDGSYPIEIVASANGVDVSRTFTIDVRRESDPTGERDAGTSSPDVEGSPGSNSASDGCGCATGNGSPASALLVLIGLVGLRGRFRRRRDFM